MKRKLNNSFNDKLKELFIFTKDINDMVEYNEILRILEDIDYTKYTLSYHLKYNYCMTKKIGEHSRTYTYYTGLKIK